MSALPSDRSVKPSRRGTADATSALVETPRKIHPGLSAHLARLFPAHHIATVEPLAPDTGATSGASAKAAGYGLPVRIVLAGSDGSIELVWRVASANEFGHDRRADRAANLVLAFDDFERIPDHVRALDVGAIQDDGSLVSIGRGEFYLLTTFARGTIYADDLRRIARERVAREDDLSRAAALASYLAKLHVPIADRQRYRRAIRDLVGHGEGIFGIVDGYPAATPGLSQQQLRALEQRCTQWRWRLRTREDRLTRTHGDFHPFNVVFDGERFTLLDASRGSCGDPADDVTAMAINYILFALDAPDAWAHGLGPLWQRFWDTYSRERPDEALTEVAPPFFAWRALVVCNPRFYPHLGATGRAALIRFAEIALDAGRLDPARAAELFR